MMEFDSTDNPGRFFFALSKDLKSIALSNIQFFKSGKQSNHAKFHVLFRLLYEYLDIGIEPTYAELSKLVSEYDYSPEIKGNGYRSLLRVVQKCCLHLLQLCRYISTVRDSMLFRKKVYAKELESYVSALGQLRAVLYYALKLTQYCQRGHLFADEDQLNSDIAEALMIEVESLSQEYFYGRCLGFQYCESMQRPVQAIGIVMASLSEGYLESSQVMRVATSVFNSGKYFLDPELRAKQMVKVTRTADIRFCQTFWNFPESPIMHQLPSFVCPMMEVNEMLTLGPDAFELPSVDGGETVTITPPCAHTGPGHVYTRLISAQLRDGQVGSEYICSYNDSLTKSVKSKGPVSAKPRVPGLVVHFHGGGFVAQSSKSHEVYLRDWAVSLDCPILSVDYSLAPQAPFPRALEECFYAYAWAVQNCEQLGSTGEKIIVVGDSAGGNLAISTAMRAASFGIRPPDGAVLVYPCTVVKYTPSPARLLSLMDPLLPVGLMTRCLAGEEVCGSSPTLATSSPTGWVGVSIIRTPPTPPVISNICFYENDRNCQIIYLNLEEMPTSTFEVQNFSSHSPLHLLRRAAVVKNPYMSPLMASDEMLAGLTRVSIIGCHLDPLLDDSVMMARRLRDLGVPVDLHLVDDLPHGFLNFALLSMEARQAADLCGRKIRDML
ncbi:hypothetical protein EGW08_006196, partial [Elysia chlorotica]